MQRIHSYSYIFVWLLLGITLLSGCGSSASGHDNENKEPRDNTSVVLVPEALGKTVFGNDLISIDASNCTEGYIMATNSDASSTIKMQIQAPNHTTYTYVLAADGKPQAFPLSGGSGSYKVSVLQNVQDTMYALLFSKEISAKINDEFKPFLYPNQYCQFTKDSDAVKKGSELAKGAFSDLDVVTNVYNYVIENVAYDEAKAQTVKAGYLPNIDETLKTKIGICFDYAALMTSMLRSQRIPTRLEVGYSGTAYHSWISVWLKDIGWVDNIIEFNGKDWSLMDPTLAANNSNKSVKKYISDGSNYTLKYSY